MPFTTYTYNRVSDFGGAFNVGRMTQDLRNNKAFVTALDGVSEDVSTGTIFIVFRAPLSSSEKLILDGNASQSEQHPPIPGSALANHTGQPLVDSSIARMSPEKPQVAEAWFHSPNWCDPTTWWQESIRVTDQLLTSNDQGRRVFSLNKQNIIDLVHGKVAMEDHFSSPYLLHVYVDGVEVFEDEPLSVVGEGKNDFDMNYAAGQVSFHDPVPENAVVTADFSYTYNSTWTISADPGKRVLLQAAEIEFTTDFDMTDTIHYQAFAPAALVAAGAGVDVPTLQSVLTAQYGGTRDALFGFLRLVDDTGTPLQRDLEDGDKVPVPTEHRIYKTYWDFKSQSNGNYPMVPAVGGPVRGTRHPSVTHPYDYRGAKAISSVLGTEVRCWLEHHRPYGGSGGGGDSRATATFYAIVEDDV